MKSSINNIFKYLDLFINKFLNNLDMPKVYRDYLGIYQL